MPRARSQSTRQLVGTVLRRRKHWVAAVCLVAGLATLAAVSQTEPAYQATARLRLEGHTMPSDLDANTVTRYAEDHVRSRYGSPDGIADDVDAWGLTTADVSIDGAKPGGPKSISVELELHADAGEARTAERAVREIAAALVASDARSADAPAVPPAELEAARRELIESNAAMQALEEELAAFGRDNAAALPGFERVSEQAIRQAEQETAGHHQQIATLEARRAELDRALAEMQRGAAGFDAREPLTSDALAAAQARWAALRGRFGENHPEAVALGREIATAQSLAAQRFEAARAELGEAEAEFARLERTHPIDHPDVVRLAHRVSALEARTGELRVAGLTSSDRAYVEDLARERRDIDGRIAELRDANVALRARMADYRARADQAPLLQAQYRELEGRVAVARAGHERAVAAEEALQTRLASAREQAPGELSIVATAPARRLPLSRPTVLAAVGSSAGLLLLLLVVGLAERLDRRLSGSAGVLRLQGSLPLAEIPVLS